jgi:hypothetical protein
MSIAGQPYLGKTKERDVHCFDLNSWLAGFNNVCTKSKKAAEQKLYEVLTRNYDASSRPVQRASSVVDVHVSLALHHILDLVSWSHL